MKEHTSEFKEEIKTLGKQQSVRITYTIDETTKTLTDEDINSATPNYKASLLKSIMKSLELDSNIDIPLNTEIKFEYGLLVDGTYEYLNYGNYIVYSSEKQEDTLSYKIKCYDKLLYAMKDYEHIDVTYPCTIKQYLVALCNKIGLTFKDSDFANADRQITNELFMTTNEDGTYSSMGYTYRDVLDQIAETTGGCICLTLDDEVEVRYTNDLLYTKNITVNSANINDSIESKLNINKIEGGHKQETRSGKNLYNVKDVKSFSDGVTVDEDDWITITADNSSGTSVKYLNCYTNNLDLKTDTNYAIILEIKQVTGTGQLNALSVYRNEGQFTSEWKSEFTAITTNKYKIISKTVSDFSSSTAGLRTFVAYGRGKAGTITFRISVLEDTSVNLDTFVYEKYETSPSPDFPSKIKTVGNNINFINMGDSEEKTSNGMTYSIKNNVLKIKGTATANTTLIFTSKTQVDLKANTYTLNANKNGSLTGVFGYYIYGALTPSGARKVLIDGGNLASSTNTGIKTQTLTENNYYNCCFGIYFAKNCTTDMTLMPKLEEGSVATPYSSYNQGSVKIDVTNFEQHQSQSIIMPIQQEMLEGDYVADVEHHEWKKLVLTGDETITYYDAPSTEIANNLDTAYFTIGISEKAQGNLNNIISNMFKNLYTASAIWGNTSSTSKTLKESISVDSAIRLRINKDRLKGYENSLTGNEKITLLKTYIKSKYDSITPIIIYYKLATPVNLELTEEQKTVRNQKLYTYENITNINTSDDLVKLDITYATAKETIDEEYINDTNVNFGEKYGPINSIVLARAGDSDKIYKKDQDSIETNGLCELMISENQFMNFNDRSDYLQELSNKLFGIEYYLNDFVSTGVMYLDLLDMYNIKIYDNTYNCLMLNDEQLITQGLEENIYTERPETSETDYKKADTTDRKINQTYLIVNKQEQKIEGVISQIGDRSEKTTTITADIDGLNSKVSNIADLTNTISGTKTITLENCVEGRLLELHIFGNNTVFDYLYPANDLYPSDTLYPKGDSRIVVSNSKAGSEEILEEVVYELGVMDVLRQNGAVYDEYVLKDGKAQVIRRINKDGSIKDNEEIEDLGEYIIYLKEGTNEIEIQNYSANINAKWAIKSDYTDVFATKVEMNSEIKQTADSINLEVRKKVDENEVISKINQSAEQIQIEADKISLKRKKYKSNRR